MVIMFRVFIIIVLIALPIGVEPISPMSIAFSFDNVVVSTT